MMSEVGRSCSESNLAQLGTFCRQMGRETNQGEIGLVIGDEYLAIRDYEEDQK
jgi:hypothetical protein